MTDRVAAAWQHLAGLPQPGLSELFVATDRLDLLSGKLDLPGGSIRFDWSKTHLDSAHLAGFAALAEAVDSSEHAERCLPASRSTSARVAQ
jgi:glucose-6-phosphate isomerase